MAKTNEQLFEEYQKADDLVQDAKKAHDIAVEARSITVKAIVDVLGNGPFDYNGKAVTAVGRTVKDDDDNVVRKTWFFKAAKNKITVIKSK